MPERMIIKINPQFIPDDACAVYEWVGGGVPTEAVYANEMDPGGSTSIFFSGRCDSDEFVPLFVLAFFSGLYLISDSSPQFVFRLYSLLHFQSLIQCLSKRNRPVGAFCLGICDIPGAYRSVWLAWDIFADGYLVVDSERAVFKVYVVPGEAAVKADHQRYVVTAAGRETIYDASPFIHGKRVTLPGFSCRFGYFPKAGFRWFLMLNRCPCCVLYFKFCSQ